MNYKETFGGTMLSELRLSNFKSFSTVQHAPLAPVTLIYGPNSGGKSSVIQSLLLLKQSTVSTRSSLNTLDFNGSLVDLGDFRNVAFRHTGGSQIELGFSYTTEQFSRDTTFVLPLKDFTRSVDLAFSSIREKFFTGSRSYVGVTNCRYALSDPKQEKTSHTFDISLSNANDLAKEYGLRYRRDRASNYFTLDKNDGLKSLRSYILNYFSEELTRVEQNFVDQNSRRKRVSQQARAAALDEILSQSLFTTTDFLPSILHRTRYMAEANNPESPNGDSDEVLQQQYLADRYQLRLDVISRFADEIRYILSQISYIGPFRRPPERVELLRERDMDTVGRSGEYFHYMLNNHDRGATRLNDWLKKLHVPYTLSIDRSEMKNNDGLVGRVVFLRYFDNRVKIHVSASDIGYGIGQIIPIIVEGILSQGKIILVEQPELHLHPKLQADVADLFLDTARTKNNIEGNQWIIETHSELLLLRILRRIREREFDARDVRILYVDPQEKDGSRIYDMELSSEGQFRAPWPQGFFDEQANEVFAGA